MANVGYYKQLAVQIANEFGLDPQIFLNQIGAESSWRVDVPGSSGEIGLGQLMPGTAKEMGVTDRTDPVQNLRGSAGYLRKKLDEFDGNYRLALAAYRQGAEGVRKNGIDEASHKYISNILTPEQNLRYAAQQYGGELTLPKFREAFPMYKGVDDETLMRELHEKFYPDVEYGKFRQAFGGSPGILETAKSLPGATVYGAREMIGSIPQSIPILQRAGAEKKLAEIEQQKQMFGSTWLNRTMEAGIRQILEQPVEESWLYKLGGLMKGEETAPSDIRAGYPYQIAKTVGQFGGQLGMYAALGPAGQTAQAASLLATSPAMEISSMYERGRAQGIDATTSAQAAQAASGLGLLDVAGMLPLIGAVSRITKGIQWAGKLGQMAAKYPRSAAGLAGAVEEALTEIPQSVGEDQIAREYYKEAVDSLANARDSGIVAGASGYIGAALMAAIGIRLRPKAAPKPGVKEETGAPEIKTPEATMQQSVADAQANVARLQEEIQLAQNNMSKVPEGEQGPFAQKIQKLTAELELEQSFLKAADMVAQEHVVQPAYVPGQEGLTDTGIGGRIWPSVLPQSMVQTPAEMEEVYQSRFGPRPVVEPQVGPATPPVEAGPTPSFQVPERPLPAVLQRILNRRIESELAGLTARVESLRAALSRGETGVKKGVVRQARAKLSQLTQQVKEGTIDPVTALNQVESLKGLGEKLTVPATQAEEILAEVQPPGPNAVIQTEAGRQYQSETAEELTELLQIGMLRRMAQQQQEQGGTKDVEGQREGRRKERKGPGPVKAEGRGKGLRPVEQPLTGYVSEVETGGRESKRMAGYMLAQMVKDLQQSKDPEVVREVEEYMADPDTSPLSYRWIKEVLGLPDAIDEAIKSGKASPEAMFDAASMYTFDPVMALKPMWFSKMNVALQEDIRNWPKKLTPEDVFNRMTKLVEKGQFKREELDDLLRLGGLRDYLHGFSESGEKISREDLATYIAENQIQVQEIVRGEPDKQEQQEFERIRDEVSKLHEAVREKTTIAEMTVFELNRMSEDAAQLAVRESWPQEKFNEYVRYLRSTITDIYRKLDEEIAPLNAEIDRLSALGASMHSKLRELFPKHEGYSTRGGSDYGEIILYSPVAKDMPVDTIHFSEGIGRKQIGWIRHKTFNDQEGNKVFVVEEIQSPRHQKGKQEGYGDRRQNPIREKLFIYELEKEESWRDYSKNTKQYNQIDLDPRDTAYVLRDPENNFIFAARHDRAWTDEEALQSYRDYRGEDLYAVPDAPFRQSWERLMMRRALREAVERGAKYLVWPYGEVHIERYSDPKEHYKRRYGSIETKEDAIKKIRNDAYDSGFEDILVEYDGMDSRDARRVARLLRDGWTAGAVLNNIRHTHLAANTIQTLYDDTEVSIQERGTPTSFKDSKIWRALVDAARPAKVMLEMVKFGGTEEAPTLNGQAIHEVTSVGDGHTVILWNAQGQRLGQFNQAGAASIIGRDAVDTAVLTGLWRPGDTAHEYPGIEITPQIEKQFTNQPMMLYSFDPVYALRQNLRGLKGDLRAGITDKVTTSFTDDTFSWLDKHVVQPWWAAKGNPRLEPIVRAAHEMGNNFFSGFSKSVEVLNRLTDSRSGLSKQDRGLMWETMWSVEGKKIEGLPEQFLIKPDETAELNPEYYPAFNQWARERVPVHVADMMTEVRRSLDEDHITRWNLAVGSKNISSPVMKALKETTFGIPNYLPHTRYGKYVLEGYKVNPDGSRGEKVIDHATDLSLILDNLPFLKDRVNKGRFEKTIAPQLIERLKSNPLIQELGPIEWNLTKRVEQNIDFIDNQPLLALALDDVITRAAGEMPNEKMASAIRAALPKAVADTLRSRGDWGHTAKRKGILGFETDNMEKVLYDYKMGLHAGLSKMQGSQAISQLVKDLDPAVQNEYDFATGYIKDVLAPTGNIERAVGTLRSIAGLKYLAGNMKTALVNLTTFWLQGGSRLAMDTGVSADRFIAKAMSKFAKFQTTGTGLEEWQSNMLRDLVSEGVIQSQMINEVRTRVGKNPGTSAVVSRIFDIGMAPVAYTERWSRAITALAAADAALSGRVKGLDIGPVSGELTDAQYNMIKDYAETIVLDSHGLYGKANRPSFTRSGRLGKAAAGAYTFRTFQQNLLHMYSYMIRNGLAGNKDALYGVARGLIGNFLIAGAGALPLALTMRKIYREWLPKEAQILGDDPLLWARDQLPFGKDFFSYGLSGSLGVSTASSFSMETPESFEEILGVPLSIAKDVVQAKKAYDAGDLWKMTEAVVPVAVMRNILRSHRLATEGQTTLTGRPVTPGGVPGEPMQLTSGEAVLKAFGFQPLRLQKAWDATEVGESIDNIRQAKQSKIANNWANALKDGNSVAMEQTLNELLDWNLYWAERGRADQVINIQPALKSRLTPDLGPKQSRYYKMQLLEQIIAE